MFRFRTESSWKVDVRSGSCRGVTLRDGAMAAQRQTGGLRDSDEWEVEDTPPTISDDDPATVLELQEKR